MKRLTPLPLHDITIRDTLFGHYIEKLHTALIPYQWSILNDQGESGVSSGCLRNFRIAAELETGERRGVIFQDSDLAKWLEAVAYSLQTHPDADLEARADACIELLAKAQGEDGYLNTYYTLTEPDGRWTNLTEGHELYCAGHFIEAAVAYSEATGKRRFLDVMCRNADLIDRVFGPKAPQCKGYPGHEELELALVKLYRATGEMRYIKLAEHFIAQRGQEPRYFEEELARRGGKTHFDSELMVDSKYAQTHMPPVKQTTAEGHAVRAAYLYCAMADIAQEMDDEALRSACRSIFHNIAREKMYLTGGVGSAEYGERFSASFDLPNDTCYCETCASIGLALFSLRMCRLERDAAYADVMERALYNTVLAGVNRDGNRFFYVNPLEVTPAFCDESTSLRHVKPERQQWFDVACCPTNIARTIMSIGGYAFGQDGEALYIHIPLAGEVHEGPHALRVESAYPFGSRVTLTALADGQQVRLRSGALAPVRALRLNGEPLTLTPQDGYLRLPTLRRGDCVEAELDMTVHPVVAHARVTADAGKATAMRGPIVYCAEQADNGAGVASLALPAYPAFEEEAAFTGDGAVALRARGTKAVYPGGDALYCNGSFDWQACEVRLIPYYLWANRGEGEMRVYLNIR